MGLSALKVYALALTLFGAYWTYESLLHPLFFKIFQSSHWTELLTRLLAALSFGVIGLMLFISGILLIIGKLTRDLIKNSLSLLSAIVAIVLMLLGLVQSDYRSSPDPSSTYPMLFSPGPGVLPIHVMTGKLLLRSSGIVPVKGEFLGRGWFQALAFALWMWLSSVHRVIEEGGYLGYFPLIFSFLLTIVIPYYSYKIAVKHLVRDTLREEVELDSPVLQAK